ALRSPGSALHDILLQRRERSHELLLLARRHPELVEALAEVLDQRVEVLAGNAHTAMRAPHVAAAVDARPAAGLADLLHQQDLQPRNVGVGKEPVDPAVARDIAHAIINHRTEGGHAAEPLVQSLLGRTHVGVSRSAAEHGRQGRGNDDSHWKLPLRDVCIDDDIALAEAAWRAACMATYAERYER